jgi:N-acetylneuraminic acid mutarotase
VVGGELIVFGGEIFVPEADVFPNVWRFNLTQNRWLPLPDLPTPRHGLGAGRIDDKIYVIGGATKPGGSGTTGVNEILTIG